jgi:hypothetical protein
LVLDCVGGQAIKDTARLAGKGSSIVVYGSMAQEDVWIPPWQLVFKDIHVRGFWRSGWFNSSTFAERIKLLDELVALMVSSKVTMSCLLPCSPLTGLINFGRLQFREPVHEIVKIEGTLSDEEATRKVREVCERVNKGTGGTKILLEVEAPKVF